MRIFSSCTALFHSVTIRFDETTEFMYRMEDKSLEQHNTAQTGAVKDTGMRNCDEDDDEDKGEVDFWFVYLIIQFAQSLL